MGLEGVQLSHYRVRSLIARGGMGEIYLADDTNLPRQVAIKVVQSEPTLYPNATATQEANRLFEREMRLVSSLDHPYILQLLDYGTETVQGKPTTYMVMPYRAEGSLIDWLRKRGNREPLPPQDVAHFVRQAADALQHAHDRNILHMDVKPSNFLIRNRQETPTRPDLLLMDFGISKAIGATKGSTTTSRGTLAYMASEQWSGHPVPASDQYALAIMAYDMLTGQFPFRGSDMQIMYQHMQTAPVPPSLLNNRLPRAIDAVILRALAKNPQDRYPSIRAFADAFQQAAGSSNTITPPPPPPVPPHPNAPGWGQQAYPLPHRNQQPNLYSNQTPWSSPGQFGQAPQFSQAPLLSQQPQFPQKSNMVGRIVLIALAVLIVLVGAVYLFSRANTQPPTVDGNATATAQIATSTPAANSPTPNITATSVALANPNPYGQTPSTLQLLDPLSANQGDAHWEVASTGDSSCQFSNGAYHIKTSKSSFSFFCAADGQAYAQLHNFVYEVQMTILKGDAGGMGFRVSSANTLNAYYLRVSQNGYYALILFGASNRILLSGTSAFIHTGLNQTNTLAVAVIGDRIDFYINAHHIDGITDSTYTQGQIALVANELTNTTEIAFTNVRLWA